MSERLKDLTVNGAPQAEITQSPARRAWRPCARTACEGPPGHHEHRGGRPGSRLDCRGCSTPGRIRPHGRGRRGRRPRGATALSFTRAMQRLYDRWGSSAAGSARWGLLWLGRRVHYRAPRRRRALTARWPCRAARPRYRSAVGRLPSPWPLLTRADLGGARARCWQTAVLGSVADRGARARRRRAWAKAGRDRRRSRPTRAERPRRMASVRRLLRRRRAARSSPGDGNAAARLAATDAMPP